MDNLLTTNDLLVLSVCTATLMVPKFSDLHAFIEKTLGRPVMTHELALHTVYDECKDKLKDQYNEVLLKMNRQAA